MSEQEKDSTCENCGSTYRLVYDDEQVSYNPDNCPFCGDLNEVIIEDLNFNDDDEEVSFADWEEDDDKE